MVMIRLLFGSENWAALWVALLVYCISKRRMA